MSTQKKILEKIYENPGAVWTSSEPPEELIELVESGKVEPCKAIDMGCGEGYYSIYLAKKGFDVLGIDLIESAIEYAKENAAKYGANARFMAMDAADLGRIEERFGFILEWDFLHHVMPPQRKKYVQDVSVLLDEGGKYLSVCFNEQSPEWGGPGKKYRESPLGTRLYYSSQQELIELFGPHFRIIETRIIPINNEKEEIEHTNNYFFMEKC